MASSKSSRIENCKITTTISSFLDAALGKEIEKRFENIETRAVVLGHLQRGGSPNAFDRVLATRFRINAIDFVHEGKFSQMVAIQGNAIVSVSLKDIIGKRKRSILSSTK